MSGVIHIDRNILSHPVVGISRPRHMAAWIWMVAEARWKDGTFNSFGETIEVKRGQFVASRKRLSEKTGLSEKEIRTFLVRLERDHMVTKTVQARGQAPMLITICNYEEYQDLDNYRAKLRANEGPARGQRGANKRKRVKQGKECLEKNSAREGRVGLGSLASEMADEIRNGKRERRYG